MVDATTPQPVDANGQPIPTPKTPDLVVDPAIHADNSRKDMIDAVDKVKFHPTFAGKIEEELKTLYRAIEHFFEDVRAKI